MAGARADIAGTCAVFPHDMKREQAVDGGYAWALWRPYSCCERKGQIFLGSVDFAQSGSGGTGSDNEAGDSE